MIIQQGAKYNIILGVMNEVSNQSKLNLISKIEKLSYSIYKISKICIISQTHNSNRIPGEVQKSSFIVFILGSVRLWLYIEYQLLMLL